MTDTHRLKPAESVYRPAQLKPILFIALIFFLTFVARVIISPLMPKIEESLDLPHTQAGALFLLMSVGYFISLMSSGFVSAKIYHRKTIIFAVCGAGLALCAMSLTTGLWGMRGSVFLLGMAAGLYLPSGITTLTDMIDPRQWGKAISLHEMAPNLAFVAAPLIAEGLLLYLPWRGVTAIIGFFCISTGLIFALKGRGGNFAGKPPGFEAFHALFITRTFWIMIILFGLAISSTMGIYTMLPLYLIKDIGLPANYANTIISGSRLLGMGSVLISGWATDRFGPRRTIVILLGLTGVSTILLGAAASPGFVIACVFVQAVLSTGYFPAGFAVLSRIGPPGFRNIAVSFTIPFAFVFGGGVIPTIIGISGDAGSFSAGIILVGILIAAGAVLPIFIQTSAKEDKK